MDFDYDSLVTLSAVIREGSFDGASRQMGVTQSAVSQRIKQLEDRVGTVLVIRGRPCVPTETGMQLCQHIEQVSLLQRELSDRLATFQHAGGKTTAAVIRIALNNDSLATWFPDVIKRAAEELNLRFEVIPDDQEHTEQALKSGEALAVATTNAKPIHGCRRESLGSMEYVGVAEKTLFETGFEGKVTLERLGKVPCIFFDRKDTLLDQWLVASFGETVRMMPHMVPSYEGYLSCCVNGAGWGVLPASSAKPYLDSGKLIELVPGKRIEVSLHWQSGTQASEILRLLSELVTDEARKHLRTDAFRTD